MPFSSLNLVAALPAEAKPIAERLSLQRVQTIRVYPVYRRERIALIVCAPGKVNAAAATAYLGALEGGHSGAAWINIGIAGHAERQLGQVLLAHRITDAASGQSWNPVLPEDSPCQCESILTLDQPDLSYEQDCMVDMEASGFYPTARRFSPSALVQVIKVISDNRGESARGLSAKQVSRLMSNTLDPLETLIARLEENATGTDEAV